MYGYFACIQAAIASIATSIKHFMNGNYKLLSTVCHHVHPNFAQVHVLILAHLDGF